MALLVSGTGLGLSVLAMVLWFSRVQKVAIPDDRRLFLVLWTLGGGLGLISMFMSDATLISINAGSLALISGWGILIFYNLAGQRAASAIEPGQKIPEFTATDDAGNQFHASDFHGRTLLIKFFRGHW